MYPSRSGIFCRSHQAFEDINPIYGSCLMLSIMTPTRYSSPATILLTHGGRSTISCAAGFQADFRIGSQPDAATLHFLVGVVVIYAEAGLNIYYRTLTFTLSSLFTLCSSHLLTISRIYQDRTHIPFVESCFLLYLLPFFFF